MTRVIEVSFVGVDSWHRPIFKDDFGNYYGSTEKLVNYNDTKDNILSYISEEDLTYFGRSFDCEPMGDPVNNIKIRR